MTERNLTACIMRYLRTQPGAYALKLHGERMQRAGLPDILTIYRGRAILIEVKGPHGRVSPKQRLEQSRLVAAGATVAVVYNWLSFLDTWYNADLED